jgi:AraC-like DNA-binding protein
MEYREYEPSPALAPMVKCYWTLDDDALSHERERVFPDGCIELLFHYGDPFVKFDQNGCPTVQPRAFVHGQIETFIELQATGKIGIFSVRFRAAGLQPFMAADVSSLTGLTKAVGAIWAGGDAFERDMLTARDNEARIPIVEAFLLRHLMPAKDFSDTVRCADAILAAHGMTAIEPLLGNAPVGKRQWERKFLSTVGLTPKRYARIVRFNRALQLIEKKDFSTFTSVAHEGGFYDQAHFIRDFKTITGMNPKRYFSENLEMARFFNLD